MKVLLLIALLATAQEESDLVKAANAAKASRNGTKPKVITNADVKKAKSKLVSGGGPAQASVQAAAAAEAPVVVVPKTPDQLYKSRQELNERIAASEKKVADLERSLVQIEQSFYAENDPSYRDDVIQKRFAQTKRQLEDARKDLADARDALSALK